MWEQIERLIQLSAKPLPDEVDPERNPERRNYYRFLYHLVKWRRPFVALEIGVEAGFGSCYMARAAVEYGGYVVGIDHDAKISVPIADNFEFIQKSSLSIAAWHRVEVMVETYGKIGVVYQDSSHHYEASKIEWDLYSQFLDERAIWICDDITPAFHDPLIDPPGKGMIQYFEKLPGDKRLYPDVLHQGNTWGIILI